MHQRIPQPYVELGRRRCAAGLPRATRSPTGEASALMVARVDGRAPTGYLLPVFAHQPLPTTPEVCAIQKIERNCGRCLDQGIRHDHRVQRQRDLHNRHAIFTSVLLFFLLLTGFAYMTLLERRLIAWFQARTVEPRWAAMLQPVADGIKPPRKTSRRAARKAIFGRAADQMVPTIIVVAVVPLGPPNRDPWFDGNCIA